MRILHLPMTYAPVRGGGEWHCQKVSEGLLARGHDVQVVTGNVAFPTMYNGYHIKKAGVPREMIGGVDVIRLPYGNYFTRFLPQLKKWPIPGRGTLRKRARRGIGEEFEANMERAIDEFAPDVVMAMAHTQWNVQVAVKIRERRKFPLVIVPLIHEGSPSCFGDVMRSILKRADAIVANTPFEKDLIAEEFSIPEERVFTGLLGVDAPEKLQSHDRGKTVLYFGRKDPLKGIDLLIKAMHHVLPKHPDARLVIAGARWPGSVKIDEWIAEQPPAVRARIDSPYDVSSKERTRLLSSARCLVLPSEEESFGLVLIEAWAHETPIITLDKSVFRCIVDEGENGYLSPRGDPEGMATDICRMLDDPAKAEAMGKAGRQKTLDVYTWDSVATRYEAAYEYARANVRDD